MLIMSRRSSAKEAATERRERERWEREGARIKKCVANKAMKMKTF